MSNIHHLDPKLGSVLTPRTQVRELSRVATRICDSRRRLTPSPSLTGSVGPRGPDPWLALNPPSDFLSGLRTWGRVCGPCPSDEAAVEGTEGRHERLEEVDRPT